MNKHLIRVWMDPLLIIRFVTPHAMLCCAIIYIDNITGIDIISDNI